MTIKQWPCGERPREKLLAEGAGVLSNAELLAVLIGSGTRGRNVMEIARELLQDNGSLRVIIEADRKTLCSNNGLGPVCYARLQAALEITRRTLMESLKKGDALVNPKQTRDYLALQMRHRKHEVFACIFLDNQHQVIAFEELFRGTIDCASVHPREIVIQALQHNAAAVILAHNHPSGTSEPSASDRQITQEIKKALNLIDVRVLDHFVVGEDITSFAERDLL